MSIFKRFEVWMLLVFSLAGLIWVFWTEAPKEVVTQESATTANDRPETTSPNFAIKERRLSKEAGHLILTVTIQRSVATDTSRKLSGSDVRLVTDEGAGVETFFLPFDPEPILGEYAGAEWELRYWLTFAQAKGELWLELEGDRLAVKEGTPAWDPEALPEGIEVALAGTDWVH